MQAANGKNPAGLRVVGSDLVKTIRAFAETTNNPVVYGRPTSRPRPNPRRHRLPRSRRMSWPRSSPAARSRQPGDQPGRQQYLVKRSWRARASSRSSAPTRTAAATATSPSSVTRSPPEQLQVHLPGQARSNNFGPESASSSSASAAAEAELTVQELNGGVKEIADFRNADFGLNTDFPFAKSAIPNPESKWISPGLHGSGLFIAACDLLFAISPYSSPYAGPMKSPKR